MSNPEIAQALFVTLNTVEGHLRHAYQKLAISSRDQLPAALRSAAPAGAAPAGAAPAGAAPAGTAPAGTARAGAGGQKTTVAP
jgi:Bacterial regulatory proteins, luxR family